MIVGALVLCAPFVAPVITDSGSTTVKPIASPIGKRIGHRISTVGLEHPWVWALPDGSLLVTGTPGHLQYISADGDLTRPHRWALRCMFVARAVYDVAADPFRHQSTHLPQLQRGDRRSSATTIARARFDDHTLSNLKCCSP